MGNKKLKSGRAKKLLFILLAVVFLVLIILYNLLPTAIEKFGPPAAGNFGLNNISLKVKRLSFFGTDISQLVVGDRANPDVAVSLIEAEYSPWSLAFEKSIESLRLTGLEINGSYDGKTFAFPTLDLAKLTSKESASDSSATPFMVSKIVISDSLLKIRYLGKLFVIPFKLEYIPGKNWKEGKGQLDFIFREQIVKTSFSFDESSAELECKINQFDLETLYSFLPEGTQLSGKVSSEIKTGVNFHPFFVKFIDSSLDLENTKYNSISIPSLKLGAKGAAEAIELSASAFDIVNANNEAVKVSSLNLPVLFSGMGLKGSTSLDIEMPLMQRTSKIPLTLEFAYNLLNGSIKVQAKSEDTTLNLPQGKIKLNGISFEGDIAKGADSMKGQMEFAIGKASMPDMGVEMSLLKASLPYDSSLGADSIRKGKIEIKDIAYKNFNTGFISGELESSSSAITFNATAPGAVLPEMAINFSGKFEKAKDGTFLSEYAFDLPKYKLVIPYDAGAWFPSAQGLLFSGEIEANGYFRTSPSGIKSGAKLKISDGTVEYQIKDSSAIASGISMGLELTDLLNLQSLPSQSFKISKVTFGSIIFENIYVPFNIEGPKAILFEGIGGQWCGGTVAIQAVRINPEVKNYSIVLSCDRINLAQLLGQFNLGKAEGEGTLNGTIPLIIKDDSIRFGNGFLYSTPGDTGKISIQGGALDSFADGVPDGTPQFDQIKLAQAAIKDFEYKWVKIHLDAEEEDMLIKLQFDGKPAKPLPFVFNKEIGGFHKVDVKSPGSVFQEIRLDVNFKLPFNELMLYNKDFQDYLTQQ